MTVHLRRYNLEGEEVSIEADEFLGRVFQHEVDHLDGVLFLDRADPRSFSTWEQFERHRMAAFLERIAPYT
jgi:peptide deformylase